MPLAGFLCVLLCLATMHIAADRLAPLDLSRYDLRLVYENDFARPQKIVREEDLIERAEGVYRRKARPAPDAEWIAEGSGRRGGAQRTAACSPVSV